MLVTTFLFACQDSTSAILLATYPAMEVTWARYFVHLVVMTALISWRNPDLLRTRRPALQIFRSGLALGSTLFGMLGLRIMPLVDVSAIVWVTPVLVTALSVFMLGEKVSLAGWLSVGAGLAGVWVIVNPAGIEFTPAMMFPFLSALSGAIYQIATRMLRLTDPPFTTLFYTAIVGVAICSTALPFTAVIPTATDAALMLFLGSLGVVSHFCMIRAFNAAPANVVAPFGYTALLWASLFSVIIFSAVPTARTWTGEAMIVGAGLFIFLRERGK
jgi:drug/metabolite transporter (DMT)-like permease